MTSFDVLAYDGPYAFGSSSDTWGGWYSTAGIGFDSWTTIMACAATLIVWSGRELITSCLSSSLHKIRLDRIDLGPRKLFIEKLRLGLCFLESKFQFFL
jgi:hypothetical protein